MDGAFDGVDTRLEALQWPYTVATASRVRGRFDTILFDRINIHTTDPVDV